ncbi:helix-turn-helix domain-containing protein [uncultured Lactobacillus sp.]|uniref:helix-turn-helix domain-containing protein n=1 Tax=uncultured Lactobacillus sp. TaxID=153152 RepID=UPI00262A878B|nr:helix-turn-helix transcriptional regulator [uncultured Lactobacillus sp.]
MTIGDYLKDKRTKMHLSRKAFAEGIVDSSYLARVEKNKNEIRATTFIDLLAKQNISLSDFLGEFDDIHFQNYFFQIKASEAYVNHDIATLDKMSQNPANSSTIMRMVIEWLIATLNDQTDSYPEKSKAAIKKFLLEVELWDDDALWIIANCLGMYEIDEINSVVNRILATFDHFEDYSDYKIKLLAEIALNYLEINLEYNLISAKEQKVIDYINQLPNCSSIFYEKLKAKCLEQKQRSAKTRSSMSVVLESL